jgi:hypothetical protein
MSSPVRRSLDRISASSPPRPDTAGDVVGGPLQGLKIQAAEDHRGAVTLHSTSSIKATSLHDVTACGSGLDVDCPRGNCLPPCAVLFSAAGGVSKSDEWWWHPPLRRT